MKKKLWFHFFGKYWKIFLTLSLVFSSVIFIIIYSVTPIKLKDELIKEDTIELKTLSDNQLIKDFLVTQLTQSNNEINQKNSTVISWFYYRFLIVGFLIGGVIIYLIPKQIKLDTKKSKANQYELINITEKNKGFFLEKIIKSEVLHITIGISCVLSICIDNQIRQDVNIVNQRGLWLSEFPEKLITNSIAKYFKNTNSHAKDSIVNSDYYSWEIFLRQKNGLHRDYYVSYSYWFSQHTITFILYVLFILCFCIIEKSKTVYSYYILWFISLCLMFFAFQSKIIPSVFNYELWGCPKSPISIALINLGVSSLLLLNVYIVNLIRKKS